MSVSTNTFSISRFSHTASETVSESNNAENDRISVEISNGVALVRLNRPEKLNALDIDSFRAIADTARSLAHNQEVRAVILQGSGKAFCSGLDVKSVTTNPLNAKKLLNRPEGSVSNLAQDVAFLWRAIPAPVIAVLHGVCFGGGLQIALGADFRFATPSCKMSIMEAKWGLIPDMAGSVLLRELVSIDLAKELTMTARVFNGGEAKQYGLVSHVTEHPFEDAMKLVEEISQRSPDSVAAAKKLFNETWLASDQRALETETELQKKLLVPPLKNTLAAATQGLDLPLKMSYSLRQKFWTP